MERSQAYHPHTRSLYGLLWPETGQCYIGQTVDMDRRYREHQRAWGRPFTMVQLETMVGTREQAEDHEYAWRLKCSEAGWVPLGKTKEGRVFILSPRQRMTPQRDAIARRCKWPRAYRRDIARMPWWFRWLCWQGAALTGVVLILRAPC